MPNELVAFFAWLASNAGVGAVMSEFFESEEWFQKLTSRTKNRLVLLISAGLGLASYYIGTQVSPDILAKWQPIAAVIIGAITAYLTSQRYHDEVHN